MLKIPTTAVLSWAGNGAIRFADGSRTERIALFSNPTAVAVSPDGALFFVTDSGNNRLRVVSSSTSHTPALAR
jgi:sugar lactone lactonase YvrE